MSQPSFDLASIKQACANTLAETLGIEITSIEKGCVVGTMPVDKRTHQPMGLLHGGASVALAETLASIGGWLLASEQNKVVVGLEINANHMKSIRQGMVTGTAKVIHVGRTSQVWEIIIQNLEKKTICASRCTLAVIEI